MSHSVPEGSLKNVRRRHGSGITRHAPTRLPLPFLPHLIGDMLPLRCPRLLSRLCKLLLRPMVLVQNAGRSHRARRRSGVGARYPRRDDLLQHEDRHRAVRDPPPQRLQRLADVRCGGGDRGLRLPPRRGGVPADPEQWRFD
eukprot:gene12880-biopygen12928